MGQYQQWLHYREIEHDLQAQLEMLERELAQLQERSLEQNGQQLATSLQADNTILQALAIDFNGQVSPKSTIDTTSIPASLLESLPNEPVETMSSALFAWGNLPNFGPQTVPAEPPELPEPPKPAQTTEPSATGPGTPVYAQLDQPPPSTSPVPHSSMGLLPEDMTIFFDQHAQTEPQLEIPRWLRNLTNASNVNGPIDQETIRTNRLVQRWLERWGRQSSSQPNTRESQHE